MQTSSDPLHKFFGTPLSEWITRVPGELPIDAVGLWQVVPALRHDFGLTGVALVQAVRATVRGLLEAGAIPVRGDTPLGWVPYRDLVAPGELGVDLIVEYWQALGRDPDMGDIWFALPSDVD